MSEKKHIDRLFQEKLKDFDVSPSDAVWDNIHNQLHKDDDRERRIIPFWWKLAGVAAMLALLLTVGISVFSDSSNDTNTIVDTENSSEQDSNKSTSPNGSLEKDKIKTELEKASSIANEDSNNSNFDASSNKDSNNKNNVTSANSESDQKNSNLSTSNKNRVVNNYQPSDSKNKDSNEKLAPRTVLEGSDNEQNQQSVNDAVVTSSEINKDISNTDINKEKSEIDKLIKDSKNNVNSAVTDISKSEEIAAEDKKEESIEDLKKDTSIEDAMADANTENEKEKKLNRWNVSPNVAPVYFNSLGKGSVLDEQFVDNTNSSEVTMSYGVGGSYAINERLKVRAGINKVSVGYRTNNVIAFAKVEQASAFASSSNESVHLSNVDVNSSSENIVFLSSETLNRNITPEVINSKSSGSIKQRFGFIEVPLEMEYAVINNKFALNVIGGFSTLIVDENEIYSVFDGAETNIGEANNINNMSYSANFGLGINYNISEKIKVNVEPTFKYQINTFNNSSGDFQPYFIALYTGFSYKF